MSTNGSQSLHLIETHDEAQTTQQRQVSWQAEVSTRCYDNTAPFRHRLLQQLWDQNFLKRHCRQSYFF
eukprot:5758813-Amphidinium_carterae.1